MKKIWLLERADSVRNVRGSSVPAVREPYEDPAMKLVWVLTEVLDAKPSKNGGIVVHHTNGAEGWYPRENTIWEPA